MLYTLYTYPIGVSLDLMVVKKFLLVGDPSDGEWEIKVCFPEGGPPLTIQVGIGSLKEARDSAEKFATEAVKFREHVWIGRIKKVTEQYQLRLSKALLEEMNAENEKVLLQVAYALARLVIFNSSTDRDSCTTLERNVFRFVLKAIPNGSLSELVSDTKIAEDAYRERMDNLIESLEFQIDEVS